MKWLLVAAAIAILWWLVSRRGRSLVAVASPQAPDLSEQPAPFALSAGESLTYGSSATIESIHQVVEHVGGYSGASFRVMRGVYLRSGGMRGHSVSHDALQADDSGSLYVTTARVVFVGVRSSIEFKLDQIRDVTAYDDGVMTARANAKTLFFSVAEPKQLARALTAQLTSSELSDVNEAADEVAAAPPPAPVSVTMHMKGPAEKITAAIASLRQTVEQIVSQYRSEFTAAASQEPTADSAAIPPEQAVPHCQSALSRFQEAFQAYSADATSAGSMDAYGAVLKSFFQAVVLMESELRSAKLPAQFRPAKDGFTAMLNIVLDDCEKWPGQLDGLAKNIVEGQECDVRLVFTVNVAPYAKGIAESARAMANSLTR